MSNTVVDTQGLSKIFRRDSFEVAALEDVNLSVAEGEFLCLMGPWVRERQPFLISSPESIAPLMGNCAFWARTWRA